MYLDELLLQYIFEKAQSVCKISKWKYKCKQKGIPNNKNQSRRLRPAIKAFTDAGTNSTQPLQ